MNGIAYECSDHNMYVLDDNVFVEVMNETGISCCGCGETIVTNLNNMAMPLIRYNQGDLIKTDNLNGRLCNAKVICSILGRKMQEITFENFSINAFAFSEVISAVNNQLDDVIINYQFVYSQSSGKLRCKLILDESRNEWLSSVQAAITDVFKSKFNILMHNNDIILLQNFEIYNSKQRAITIEE